MKRIYISTITHSMNYGAFLQGYALYTVLSTMKDEKYDVSFLKTHARHPFKATIKNIIKDIIRLKFRKIGYDIHLYDEYRRIWNSIKYQQVSNINEEDFVITGSDEIWNIHRKDMLKFPIFFGIGQASSNIIAYAPSCNITNIEEFRAQPQIIKALNSYSAIGVRDEHTKKIIQQLVEIPVNQVLDPTLLIKREFYDQIKKDNNITNYILVYSLDNKFKTEHIKEIKKFAIDKGLKLIALGIYLEWCDENIVVSPNEFIGLIANANYVVTNSFHGSVFSTIFEKQFAVYSTGKKKVENLIKDLGLEDRNMEINDNLDKVLNSEIPYDIINKKLEEKRISSMGFLRNALKDNI